MNWFRWNSMVLPTVLVGVMWLLFSTMTTLAIRWLEGGYQRVLDENVTTIESVGEMQHALWTLQDKVFRQATLPLADRQTNFESSEAALSFRASLAKAHRTALTENEQQIVTQIRRSFDDYLADLKNTPAVDDDPIPGERAFALAAEISEHTDRLLEINQRLIDDHTVFYQSWSSRIRWAGIALTVVGPLLGIALGLRASSKLKQRIMRLRVTLAGAAGDVKSIDVEPDFERDDLAGLDEQARIAAIRIEDVLKQLEVARRDAAQNERLAVVGQIAAGVAHELRNPLTSVKLLVQTVASKADESRDDQEPFAVLISEIERMERTIQSLLDYARPSVQHLIRHNVQADVARAVNLVQARAERDGVTINVEQRVFPIPITADPDLMQQVFVNLLLNALDAMPQSASHSLPNDNARPRTIDVSFSEVPNSDDSAASDACRWRVSVRDHGPGILDGQFEEIFAPFMTTKARGTGLGLAVSRRIIEEHRGRLWAMNHSDGGAVFVVDLPFAED